jgi:cob(I)alamin adenosyltransferase
MKKEHLLSKGLVIVLTGDGKGKTSAALGIALRAYGHNMSICVIQFIKGSFVTGESLAAERLGIEFVSLGKGFVTGKGNDLDLTEHRSAAEKALALARQRMFSGSLDILILDEINNAVELGLLDITAVLDLVKNKPANLHVVLTGRNAHPDLISAADLATEMHSLKHPFDSGVPAQKGIDY